jgi:hypothetical protein
MLKNLNDKMWLFHWSFWRSIFSFITYKNYMINFLRQNSILYSWLKLKSKKHFGQKNSRIFLIVSLAWTLPPFFSSIPFLFFYSDGRIQQMSQIVLSNSHQLVTLHNGRIESIYFVAKVAVIAEQKEEKKLHI